MDPIDQVLEANRVQALEFDFEGSENSTSGISSLDSTSDTAVHKDFKTDLSYEPNGQLTLSGSVQTAKKEPNITLLKTSVSSNKEDEDIVHGVDLLQIKSHSTSSDIIHDSNNTSVEAPDAGLSKDSATLNETAEGVSKQVEVYEKHSFPKEVVVKTDSEISQKGHIIEKPQQFFPDNNNNSVHSKSQLELEDHSYSGEYLEGVAFNESGMGDDLGHRTAETNASDPIKESTQIVEEAKNKPVQHHIQAENVNESYKEHGSSLNSREHPLVQKNLDPQLMDPQVSSDTLNTSKSDSQLVESPRGERQLFQLLLDDYEDDFHTDGEENIELEEQDIDEQQKVNSSSEIEDKQQEEENIRRKLVRNDAIDEDDADVTGESTSGDKRTETMQIASDEINDDLKVNNSFNGEQLGLQEGIDSTGHHKSEMEFKTEYDGADIKIDINTSHSKLQNDGPETFKQHYSRGEDSSIKGYHEDSSVSDDQKGTSGSHEMLGQNKMDVEENLVNRTTSSKVEIENVKATSNLQANQRNEGQGLQGRMMTESGDCHSLKPDETGCSKVLPTGGNSSVTQYYQDNVLKNEMKINTDENIVDGLNQVAVFNDEKDRVAISDGNKLQQKESNKQSSVSKKELESHQTISSQDTSYDSKLEPNILVKEQESVREVPSSKQTLKSIKSLGDHERQWGNDINDTQDETQNKTVVTSADPKDSLVGESLLGKINPNSQKLIKGSERNERETEDGVIRRQMNERQIEEQQNNQRKKSDEDLSHSLPGNGNWQTRNMTPLVNERLEVMSNSTQEENNQNSTTKYEEENNSGEFDGHEKEESEKNNGTNMKLGSNGKIMIQPITKGQVNDDINDNSVEYGLSHRDISQNNQDVETIGEAVSENVTQENSNCENQNKVAVDIESHGQGNDKKTENLPTGKQNVLREDDAYLGISTEGHHVTEKVSYSDTSSNRSNESVPRKSALKVRQAPTGYDNMQNMEGIGNSHTLNEGLRLTNNIHDTNGYGQMTSMTSNLSDGPKGNNGAKENMRGVSNMANKVNESTPRKSALKVQQVPTGNDYFQNTGAVGNNEIVIEGDIVKNDVIGTEGNVEEQLQHSNGSGRFEENTITKKVSKFSDNGHRQPPNAYASIPKKSALKVRQVPAENNTSQSNEAAGNLAMVDEDFIASNHGVSDTNMSVQEPVNLHISGGQGENTIIKEKVSMNNENGQEQSKAKIKIYPVKQDQAVMKDIRGGGASVHPQRQPNVDQTGSKGNGTNRHEGHNCPRELRRLARLKEAEEQATAGSQNQSSHQGPDENGPTHYGSAGTLENPPDSARQVFPGQGSEEAANSELIQTPSSPSSKKRRKKKPSDPFDGLPPIKPWHLHQLEMNAEIMERPKKKKKGQRRFNITQFDDPFHQMLWVLFRAADKDSNNKLNKKELSMILNSSKLQLSLTQDDIKRLLKESSTEEQPDPKTCELSFEEFIPLGRLILMLYYSKTDDSSQSKWCILDKGQDYGIIYFNKLTGDASISVPSDYYADVLHEPDLLDIAIHDLFEDADLNEDGKINLTDFLRILRSEDFGLFLTNEDVEEIMKYFVNIRGKEVMVQFDEFLPLAKRLILTVYRARDPTPHEWCHLYTRNVGSFWFNKRTGQADRHPPTSLVKTLQDLLEHRSREIEVFMEVAEDLHHTKEALQTETEKRQELEEKLSELTKQHETTIKELAKTVTNLEKSKEEVEQKSKQIRFFEKEKLKQQNVIESLQERAEEADRIEANLESLRNVLQSTQTSVREKEFDVRDLKNTLEETRKELASTKQHAASLQDKIDDLVVQLRDEIRRNERVETELERTKSYKFEKVEVEDILKETKEELEMRMNQLTHARYEIRDNKSRIRRIETELNNVPDLKIQLEEKEKEIKSFKEKIEKLEAQMIEDARLAEKYPRELVRRRRWNKARSIETPDKSHDCSDPNCPVNGRGSSSPVWAYRNNEETQTHPNGSFLELLSNIEGEDGNDSLNIYDFYEPHYSEMSPHRVRVDSASSLHRRERSRLVRPKSSAGRLETKKQSKLGRGVFLYEDDYLLARFVKEGDRVRIKKSGVNVLGMKPSDLRTATVRYVGQLDEEGAEHMLFVGLHMDDAVGDTNGIIDDKRYFYSKRRHGKMVRITEVLYLLNPKTTSFDKVSDLIEEYKASRRKRWREYPEEGPRLIRVT
ncbi:hypothetical protein HOLleu_12520 [Holothuria leucospilota]|uniref:EF-hand domain-containing protein n=1 Tax=Holothuria leucospilota TaxID=206669 RepID=A0A9Q1CBP7_HOLLE|nr:hypothetical protein HOLleu_12520 [Holothuria leucospilota]